MADFKPYILEYNELQGQFHDNYRDGCSFSWHQLIEVKSKEQELLLNRFCRYMRNYNMNYNDYIMTKHEVVFALYLFLENQEIYYVNKELPPYPGVYFLYDYDGSLVYIGKSNNIRVRLFQSIREKNGNISYYRFALTETDADAIIYEQYYMSKYTKPKYNTEYPNEGTELKLPELYFTTMTAIVK